MAVTITDPAREQLLAAMAREAREPAETAVRLGVKGGGCAGFEYVVEFEAQSKQAETDKRFAFGADPALVVLVDAKSYFYLNGTEVDWHETMMERRFVFRNPLAKSSCGCGTSFSV